MKAINKIFNTARELTEFLNAAGVAKENIATIIYKDGEFILIYYSK